MPKQRTPCYRLNEIHTRIGLALNISSNLLLNSLLRVNWTPGQGGREQWWRNCKFRRLLSAASNAKRCPGSGINTTSSSLLLILTNKLSQHRSGSASSNFAKLNIDMARTMHIIVFATLIAIATAAPFRLSSLFRSPPTGTHSSSSFFKRSPHSASPFGSSIFGKHSSLGHSTSSGFVRSKPSFWSPFHHRSSILFKKPSFFPANAVSSHPRKIAFKHPVKVVSSKGSFGHAHVVKKHILKKDVGIKHAFRKDGLDGKGGEKGVAKPTATAEPYYDDVTL